MNNAAKWKEFLRWWTEYQQNIEYFTKEFIVSRINYKVEKLQKGDNAKHS